MSMLDLASRLSALPMGRGEAPWPGCEYVKGWGVFGLPLDSGHVLALRVFPENSFAPYRTLWHRDPQGRWSLYVDGPRLDTACPRYYGPACVRTAHARIELTWTGPASLRVVMDGADSPALDWTLTASVTPLLTLLNAAGAGMPAATWRSPFLLRLRERLAGALGLGRLQLSGVMPSGHTGTLMPQQMYFIDHARATLDGIDLGSPVRLRESPRIGDVTLPARGVLAIGQAAWEIRDRAAYERTRAETARGTGDDGPA
ncbi:hypothetical protein [Streptomyces sp. NPDC048639]|uniref:hypothetical protein n=1 Tax=Streptomyces sp. NPDC048639 TaxID=3365581 RepID=UPI003718EE54